MDPLRQAYKTMQHFFVAMELEIERPSSSVGMKYFRQSQSFQLLPYSSTENLLKNDANPALLSKFIANEFKVMRNQLSQQWAKIFQNLKFQYSKVFRQLKKEAAANLQARYAAFTSKEEILIVDHQYTQAPQSQKLNQDESDLQSKRQDYQRLLQGPSKIVDMKILSEIKDKLVIFEKHYITRRLTHAAKHKVQLIVLVHGYQGTSYDMRMLENYMLLRFPQHILLVSLSNQSATEGDII